MKRIVASAFILAAIALQATASHAAILLDNTNNLALSLDTTGTTYGSNTPAYNRLNGATFAVAATPYDATSVSLGLQQKAGPSTLNVRLQFWELPTGATIPASGATPFYTQDFSNITLTQTSQYYTFPLTSGAVNLKANTRYTLGILTENGDSFTQWVYPDPKGTASTTDATFVTGLFSTNGGASFTSSASGYAIQLTGDVAPVPEPSTWALALAGVTCSAWGIARRRRRAGGDACRG